MYRSTSNNPFIPREKIRSADMNENFEILLGSTPGTAVFVIGEDLTPQINGVTVNFVLVHPFVVGRTAVYLDGLRQRRTVDYTETIPNVITLNTPPTTAQDMTIDYTRSDI